MDVLLILIPLSLILGLIGLGGYLWALRNGQFEDMEGNASRIFQEEDDFKQEK